jgi:amino acid adenylation domain-containing protein
VRTRIDPRAGFATLVDRVRDAALDDFAHQDLPFEELVAAMKVPRSLSHSPLFQVAFSLGNTPLPPPAMPGVTLETLRAHSGAVRFDLSLGLSRHDGGYRSLVEYKTDLFDAATVERWNRHLQTLLAAALDAPEAPVADLPLMTAEERRQVVVGANRTAHDFGEPALLHELVTKRAAADPSAPALSFGDQRLSYGELATRAERLARRLVALGVGAETRVAVAMHRSADMVTTLLAVLQAGGAYLPIDPDYPPGRVEHMLRDGLGSGGLLLTQSGLAGELGAAAPDGVRVLALDAMAEGDAVAETPLPAVDPDSPAYVIYTSGSTGVPKGAVNRHRSIVNRLLWMRREFAVGPGDRVLHKAPFSFDVSIWEIFVPLVSGAELVIAEPGGHRDAAYLARLIAEHRVTVAQFVPSLFAVFLDLPQAADCRSLSRVVASGEALPPELARRFGELFPDAALYNVYGPTETAVGVTFKRCDAASAARMTLGQAISNVRVHVVDERLAAQPPGVVGELAIGGVQLGRGYLDRPGLTAGRFVPDPFAADFAAAGDTASAGLAGDGRLYLTGDLARWLPPDGERPAEIEFLGRRDHQVKLRGLRIELGEIESLLGAVDGVAAAVVTLRDDGLGPRLVGYLVMAEGAEAPPAAELRRALGRRLPDFMVPADFVVLDVLPTTPTGKLDRDALPAPDAPAERREHVEPETAAEELIAEVWAEALELERVGAHDDFFELGGHSLLATMVVARLGRALDLEVPVRLVFEHPRLDALAAALEEMLIEETGWSEDDAPEGEG